MKTHVAHSDSVDTLDAARELIESCNRSLAGDSPKAGILFASVDYDHDVLLATLRAEWPDVMLVGGSSDGEISSELGFCHDSIVLTVFAGEGLEVHAGLGRDLSQGIPAAVASAVEGLEGVRPTLCIGVFAPTTNSSEVVRELNRHFDDACPIVGGLTGAPRGEQDGTLEFFADEVLTDSIPLLFLSGDFSYSWGLGSGWFPIGDTHEVTRAEGHVVYEIDDRPALEIYEKHYGAVPTSSLGEYPLAVYGDDGTDEWALRAILDSDRESGLLRFAGEVVERSRVRMTEVLAEGILSGSSASLQNALQGYGGERPELALVFSCAARKWVLGTKAEEEIGELRDCAARHGSPDLAIAGLYVFGEISPANEGNESRFHNETCVSLVLGR